MRSAVQRSLLFHGLMCAWHQSHPSGQGSLSFALHQQPASQCSTTMSRMLPDAKRRRRASWIADFAVSWHSAAARQAILYLRRATSPGFVRMRFQAATLALTDSEHSGVRHGGSDGRVLSCLAGINCFMPRLMCAVMLEHAASTVPESMEC